MSGPPDLLVALYAVEVLIWDSAELAASTIACILSAIASASDATLTATPCGVSVPTLMCVVVVPTVRSRPEPVVIGSVAVKPRAVVTCALASAVTSKLKVPTVAPADAVAATADDEEVALADCHVGLV